MKVISTTDLSRSGNDCYIYESVSLVEQFELFSVIRYWRVVGWSDREEVSVLYTSLSRSTATEKYKSYGGRF
jgi:hypothetical protein